MRKLRRLPWRLPRQNAGNDHTPPPRRDEPREAPVDKPEPTQPVAYIGGRYVYGTAGDAGHGTVRARPRGTRVY